MASSREFDFIVVGAGTTGCVVAGRLSARGYSVLLLDAGASDTAQPAADAVFSLPKVFDAIFKHNLTRAYPTVMQAGLGWSMPILQATVRGGGSSINGMLYVRGNRRD
jgi:choline dehydrogenase